VFGAEHRELQLVFSEDVRCAEATLRRKISAAATVRTIEISAVGHDSFNISLNKTFTTDPPVSERILNVGVL
jgi:hypothetical protein